MDPVAGLGIDPVVAVENGHAALEDVNDSEIVRWK
jgi:hypothetical protein